MSVPFQYWGSAAHMSADLKRTIHAVRTARPDLFAQRLSKETSMDGEGKVSTKERRDAKAIAPTGARRHALCFESGRF